jgi:hypothetical protein
MKGSLHEPKRLSGWTGNVLDAGAGLSRDGTMRGAILFQDGKDRSNLEVVNWFLDRDSFALKQHGESIKWFADQVISKSRIAVSDSGKTVLLLTAANGNVYSYDGQGSLQIIRQEISRDLLSQEIGFVDNEPVLLIGSRKNGFRILTFDGSPMELPSSPKGDDFK